MMAIGSAEFGMQIWIAEKVYRDARADTINLHVTHGNLLIRCQVLLEVEAWRHMAGRPPLFRRANGLASDSRLYSPRLNFWLRQGPLPLRTVLLLQAYAARSI
jgi:hypothetical protein